MINLSIKYSSIPIFAAMYAVNVTSPAQLPLVSGCRNSGDPLSSWLQRLNSCYVCFVSGTLRFLEPNHSIFIKTIHENIINIWQSSTQKSFRNALWINLKKVTKSLGNEDYFYLIHFLNFGLLKYYIADWAVFLTKYSVCYLYYHYKYCITQNLGYLGYFRNLEPIQ